MTSELRNAVALWSDPSPPNDFCHYDHCSAKALFGTMRIEWKSWKDYPNYCLYFDAGETFIGSFDSLDRAKEHAAAVIEADRKAVRAEQAAELAKFKALAETLAGALDDVWREATAMRNSSKTVGHYHTDHKMNQTYHRTRYHAGKKIMEMLKPSREALREYKEATNV